MKNVRPVLKLKSKSHVELHRHAERVYQSLKENAFLFPNPPVSLITQKAAIEIFNKAITARGFAGNLGSHNSLLILREARKEVEKNLRCLTAFVNSIAMGDEFYIIHAGMIANARPKRIGLLPAPQNLHSPYHITTVQCQIRLRWSRVKGVNTYNVYMSDSETGGKTLVAITTKTLAIIELPGITRVTMKCFWVTAVGAAGESPLSAVCEAGAMPVV